MLTASGVKLLDFGLAKLRDAEYHDSAGSPRRASQLTDEGTVLGTLPYMAPEQIEGRQADARTDIFALGIVLYEMTTRRQPFQGKSRASLAAAILTHDPPPVSSLAAAAPASLDRIGSRVWPRILTSDGRARATWRPRFDGSPRRDGTAHSRLAHR